MADERSTSTPSEARDVRIGRALNEHLDRRARGEPASESDLFSRYPDIADELRRHLARLQALSPTGETVSDLVSSGILTACDDPRYLAQLGPYKITGYIGRGGMGIVLKAYEESLNRTVALKILRPELASDAAALKRFTREARAAAALRHPNIVTVHAVGQERGVHFIAMEHVPGPSLAQVIRQRDANVAAGLCPGRGTDETPAPPTGATPDQNPKRQRGANVAAGPCTGRPTGETPVPPSRSVPHSVDLSPEAIREIFRQLLSALAAAHDAGLIHRDIKSANILLDRAAGNQASRQPGNEERGGEAAHGGPPVEVATQSSILDPQSCTLKLADFGLARMRGGQTTLTATDSVLGTPEYMSPEQARGDAEIDHRTDLYSAGVVLYEMLTGRTPFRADTPTATVHRILHDEPTDPRTLDKDVDPALASLAMRLMAKSPKGRFDRAGEALAAMDTREQVPTQANRRHLRRSLLRGVAILVLAFVAIWVAWELTERGLQITDVRLADGHKNIIEIRRDGDNAYKLFVQLPPGTALTSPGCTALARLGSGREQAVLAGLDVPHLGGNLVAYGRQANQLWRRLLPRDFGTVWPGCEPPMVWQCFVAAIGNLDEHPGDEVVAVVNERGGPSHLAILDARTGTVLASFNHCGHINRVVIAPDFFKPDQPALIVSGCNNLLDDFGGRSVAADEQLKPPDWETWVPALMILDPKHMDGGIGPPSLPQLHCTPLAGVHAYGSLSPPKPNLGAAEAYDETHGDRSARRFDRILPVKSVEGGSGVFRLEAAIIDVNTNLGASLILDENLCLLRILPSDRRARKLWREEWRLWVREGEYLAAPPP
ncbi:MAG: serine/threonine protein kinase [Planctomycetes bacterium]|nr:serine/threonine protein kinase [Planctomycetota bacterium]